MQSHNSAVLEQFQNPGRRWITCGAILGGLAVVFGAFAAHGLNDFLVEKYAGVEKIVAGETIPGARKYLADFQTAAEYQMYHALALICLGIAFPQLSPKPALVAARSFLWGTILFSGSLYVLVISGITWLGAITPIGGTLFIAGWLLFGWSAISAEPPHKIS